MVSVLRALTVVWIVLLSSSARAADLVRYDVTHTFRATLDASQSTLTVSRRQHGAWVTRRQFDVRPWLEGGTLDALQVVQADWRGEPEVLLLSTLDGGALPIEHGTALFLDGRPPVTFEADVQGSCTSLLQNETLLRALQASSVPAKRVLAAAWAARHVNRRFATFRAVMTWCRRHRELWGDHAARGHVTPVEAPATYCRNDGWIAVEQVRSGGTVWTTLFHGGLSMSRAGRCWIVWWPHDVADSLEGLRLTGSVVQGTRMDAPVILVTPASTLGRSFTLEVR